MAIFNFPSNPDIDDEVTLDNTTWIWDGTKWTNISGGSGGGRASVWVGTNPPPDPATGNLWWDETGAQLYIWTGDQWVVVVNQPGGGFDPTTTGNNDTFVLQDQPTINQPAIMGVTDGSDAQPGEVGELISIELMNASTPIYDANIGPYTSSTNFTRRLALAIDGNVGLPAGDFDVWATTSVWAVYAAGVTFPAFSRGGSLNWGSVPCIGIYMNVLEAAQSTDINFSPLSALQAAGSAPPIYVAGVAKTPVMPMLSAAPVNLYVSMMSDPPPGYFGDSPTPTNVTWKMNVYARRVR